MKIKKYKIQSILPAIVQSEKISGINIPKINGKTSVYGLGGGSGGINSRMHASSGQLFTTGLVTIALDTTDLENGMTNDTSNYKITAKTAGYYLVTGKITWDTPVAAKSYWTYIYKNGGAVSNMITQPAAAAAFSGLCVALVYLAVGDYIQMKGYQNSGSNVYSRSETDLFICKV